MNCVGIDISKGKSMIAVMRPFGEVVVSPFEVRHTTNELSKLAGLLKSLDGETRVVMESTGNYHAPVARLLHGAGLYVSVVNAMLVHDYGNNSLSMLVLDIEELIPENHLLRRINQLVSFNFIYDLAAPYYSANGRPSVDPVSMFKMLLVGYLYGIKSERRLVQEVQLNIAYRWFCGFELGEKIPDHSTFSKTRVRKWNESDFFQKAFLEIVRRCIEQKLIDGKEMASDGSYIPAEVSRNSWIDVEVEVEQSSHLPPPPVGIAPPRHGGLTYSRAGGEQQGGLAA